MRFYHSRVEASRNFMNKVWNASRFLFMNCNEEECKALSELSSATNPSLSELLEKVPENLEMADKWILSKMNNIVAEVTRNLESFDLGIALDKVQGFIWEEFCDWYIEMVKPRLYNEGGESKRLALWTLLKVLKTSLSLLPNSRNSRKHWISVSKRKRLRRLRRRFVPSVMSVRK